MWDLILLLALVEPPAKATLCTPPGPRQPPLVMLDAKGGCPKDYQTMPPPSKDKSVKAQYCVSTVHPRMTECKPVSLPQAGTRETRSH